MRKIALFAILAFFATLLTACAGEDTIASRAEHFVRSTYSDVDRVLSVKVDTVSLGDNLEYRIGRAQHDVNFSKAALGEAAQKNAEAWAAALDSLRDVSASVLDDPAAYNCIVVYNSPSNIVWVQLDTQGNLLNITKAIDKLLINPGEDVPGYKDLWVKFHN